MKKKEPRPKGISMESLVSQPGFKRNYDILMQQNYNLNVREIPDGVTKEEAIKSLREVKAVRDAITNMLISNTEKNENDKSVRLKASSKGGQSTSKAKRDEVMSRHNAIVDKARKLLEEGKEKHDLSSILTKLFPLSARRIRTVLQEAGILEKRK